MTVVALVVALAAPAGAAPVSCSTDVPVKLYEHANYSGACVGFSVSDLDFSDNVFHGTSISLNDNVSSINVKSGYVALICTDANLLGWCEVFATSSSQVGYNDLHSSVLFRPL